MPRIPITSALAVILILSFFPRQLPHCEAQNRFGDAEHDFHALALTSILNCATEASKLPDIPQRVSLLLYATKILISSHQDKATRLLDIALADLKLWNSEGKTSTYQRHTAATLRNEIVALYARVNPEKAAAVQKEFAARAKSPTAGTLEMTLKTKSWSSHFSDQTASADQLAQIALSLVESDPEKALVLVIQSLQGGIVSGVLFDIFQKLTQTRNRAFLNRLEIGIGQALGEKQTLDPNSITYAAILVRADKDMSSGVRSAFITFLMRSLQAWAIAVKEPGVDTSYISRGFFAFSQTVRAVILQYSPDQLIVFDLILDRVFPLVPENMKSVVQVSPPERFSEPRDRLNDIMNERDSKVRDHRLARFVSELLRRDSKNLEASQTRFDMIAEALGNFSDMEAKSAYTELLTITHIDAFVKQKKFMEAQELADSISSGDRRAWALLALSRAVAKVDPVMGFEFITNALKALDKAPSSPQKVELALMAAAMLSKSDEQRAFETLSTAAKYANSSPNEVGRLSKPAFAFGLDASIGEEHTKLGVFPEGLGELKINSSLSSLATSDWFRADSIVNDVREPSLRLQLKLLFAGAVLAKELKSKPLRRMQP